MNIGFARAPLRFSGGAQFDADLFVADLSVPKPDRQRQVILEAARFVDDSTCHWAGLGATFLHIKKE